MRSLVKLSLFAVVLVMTVAPRPAQSADIGQTFWIDSRSISFAACMERAYGAFANGGFIVAQNSDWWVFGVGDGNAAYISCLDMGNGSALIAITNVAFPGLDAFAPLNRLAALMDFPDGPASPAPNSIEAYPGLT